MTIQVGEKIPSVTLTRMGEKGPEPITTDELFGGKKVVLFAVPGAFTPTCSAKHLPSFVEHADELKAKGIDEIICTSVNDVFVMGAWGKDQKADGKVMMLADGEALLTKALGLELDLTGKGLGLRSQRFSMLVEDGVVKSLSVDPGGSYEKSSAQAMLREL
jgi:glutaredoxin/glutathione-dependent peroxiredoxin